MLATGTDLSNSASAAVGVAALAAPLATTVSTSSSPHGSKDADDESATVGGKRKRVVLSILEKQQVLMRIETGEQPATIAHAYGISRQQVSDIKKNRERILAFCVDAKHVESLRRKTLKATTEYHPGVEQELYRWLVRQRLFGRAVTPDALTNKAAEVFMQYAAGNDASASFKTITTWLRHFKRAHGLKALTDDELAKLPDRFVSAMDMTHPVASANASHPHGVRSSSNSNSSTSITTFSALVPSMAASASASSAIPSSSMSMALPLHLTAAAPPMQLNVEDYIGGLTSVLGLHAANPQPQPQVPVQATGPSPPRPHDANAPAVQRHALDAMVATIHDISAQLSFFEREATDKLDYLDARFEKLSFLVLPPRFA